MFDPKAVLAHYQKPVPRYTSYPTAPQFKEGIGAGLFAASLPQLDSYTPVSAYLHVPFCDRLCWFCGCHTKHTLKYAPIARYMRSLLEEIRLVGRQLETKPVLGALHLGGGSPSLLKRDELQALRQALDETFRIDHRTEISVEIDPSDVKSDTIAALMEFGLTRASVGVQDFHEDVQTAINRPQSFEITRDVIQQLRAAGVSSINVDALYGLPLQSQERLLRTIEQCLSLRPDRMALFGYAHVPWLKKHQNMIKTEDLAGPLERFDHAHAASAQLVAGGYQSIGIDHFALPDDSLAVAARSNRLHRNFQGYTTDHHQTMIGFGASSIGRFANGYVQNTVPTAQYQTQVSSGELPKNKGLILTEEDQLRSYLIERLMCEFEIDFDRLQVFPDALVQPCLQKARLLAAQDQFGLCAMENNKLQILPQARPFARIVAAHFDAYYAPEQFQYSKAV
ncbi:MAG: oxygen-independent coproporphyrinogen III oxidase [Rhizobiaceae bacterium]